MLTCNKCGVELTDENWLSYVKAKHDYQCRPCYLKQRRNYYYSHTKENLERGRKWRANHVESERKRVREHGRKHRMRIWKDGKQLSFNVNKRPWTQICEVCGSELGLRAYHHWDDNKLENGMWLCRYCHIFAENVDRGLVNKYLELKAKIDGNK